MIGNDFFNFCTKHCCAIDCKDRSDYCPIADQVRSKYGGIRGGEDCESVFRHYQENLDESKPQKNLQNNQKTT